MRIIFFLTLSCHAESISHGGAFTGPVQNFADSMDSVAEPLQVQTFFTKSLLCLGSCSFQSMHKTLRNQTLSSVKLFIPKFFFTIGIVFDKLERCYSHQKTGDRL